jgi:hypothetical protein
MRETGYYWVYSPFAAYNLNWQVGHYDAEYRRVIVCGCLTEYQADKIVFGERVLRKVW